MRLYCLVSRNINSLATRLLTAQVQCYINYTRHFISVIHIMYIIHYSSLRVEQKTNTLTFRRDWKNSLHYKLYSEQYIEILVTLIILFHHQWQQVLFLLQNGGICGKQEEIMTSFLDLQFNYTVYSTSVNVRVSTSAYTTTHRQLWCLLPWLRLV